MITIAAITWLLVQAGAPTWVWVTYLTLGIIGWTFKVSK